MSIMDITEKQNPPPPPPPKMRAQIDEISLKTLVFLQRRELRVFLKRNTRITIIM